MGINSFFDIPEEPVNQTQGYMNVIKKNSGEKSLTSYLVHCYLYYIKNSPIIYDEQFDNICKSILDKWKDITHSYKELVSYDDLKAGTGYGIKEYPNEIVEDAEKRLKIFLQDLQHEVDIAKEFVKKDAPFEFSHDPIETYLLCGMYIDFKYFKSEAKKKEVWTELKRRWDNNIDPETFTKYFEDHNISQKDLNI
jgi:hypothetical protein